MRTRGSALLAALVALAVGAALVAALADLGTGEVWLAGRRRLAAEARAAADACVARVVAAVPPGWDLEALLLGPDGLAGTADDGRLVAPAACAASASPAPGPPAPVRLLADVQARAGAGSHALVALVGREPAPGVPAVVWTAASPVPGTVPGVAVLDGVDAADAAAPVWAALAAPAPADVLDAWLGAEAGRVSLGAGTGAPIVAPAPPLAALEARVRAAGPGGSERLVPAGPPPPGVALVDGDLAIAAAVYGAGVLLVTGRLDIQDRLDFTGVVIAAGGVQVATGAALAVRGALWTGALPGGAPFVVDGRLDVVRDAAALGAADAVLPLPRRARLLGVRDRG